MTCAERLIDEAIELPVEQRILMVDSLLRTLNPVDDDIEAAWVAVAERRREELRSGCVQGIPAEEVFAEARRLVAQ